MKFVIYGVGAIGGLLAAKLSLAGNEVAGIARGAQLEAIRKNGLKLRTPAGDAVARFAVADDPEKLTFDADDCIVLAMKTQDTPAALQRLRAAGVTTQAIVCAQNGVTNERFALRRFPNVYAMTVMAPATYVTAGEVNGFGMPKAGIFDIGRYPGGADDVAERLAASFNGADFDCVVDADIMASKYGKLLLNLSNIIEAALPAGQGGPFGAAARAEAESVYEAAGIKWKDLGAANLRRQELLQEKPIPGASRVGSSTAQSLARHVGSIETDFLNGEIVLLGRLHDVPTPVNAYFSDLAQRLLGEKLKPGTITAAEVEREIAAARAALADPAG